MNDHGGGMAASPKPPARRREKEAGEKVMDENTGDAALDTPGAEAQAAYLKASTECDAPLRSDHQAQERAPSSRLYTAIFSSLAVRFPQRSFPIPWPRPHL